MCIVSLAAYCRVIIKYTFMASDLEEALGEAAVRVRIRVYVRIRVTGGEP